jgi:hypothetical protein
VLFLRNVRRVLALLSIAVAWLPPGAAPLWAGGLKPAPFLRIAVPAKAISAEAAALCCTSRHPRQRVLRRSLSVRYGSSRRRASVRSAFSASNHEPACSVRDSVAS